jgi:hypothetical protein
LLYIFTGVALVVFLNSPPVEPRERDYIYVGSYFAFAVWIGLGVMALADLLGQIIKNPRTAAIVATSVSLIVPAIMAQQGWDDHDRSKRYHSVDSAKNLLNSCAKNAILFTGGDNDTFPLWYVQEVEGFRTDVRVCNLSLLGTDWYIQQMKRKTYLSEPLPIQMPYERFVQGTNDQIAFVENENVKGGMSLVEYLKLVREGNPAIEYPIREDKKITILPTSVLVLPLDSAGLAKGNLIPENLKPNLTKYMVWNLPKKDIFKPDLIVLDMIATNAAQGWKRPIYFSSTLGPSNYLNLFEHLQLEGLAYRLTPARVPGANMGFVNTDLMYDNMMNKMFWRELDNPKVYYDDNYRKFPYSARLHFYRLAEELHRQGKMDSCKNLINKCLTVIPDKTFRYDRICINFVPLLYDAGEPQKATDMAKLMVSRAEENLAYFFEQQSRTKQLRSDEIQENLAVVFRAAEAMKGKDEKLHKQFDEIFNKNYQKLSSLGGLQE